jgi:hypothetical protein
MNTYSTTVQISGSVSPDLMKATGMTARELSKLQSYVSGLNKLMGTSQQRMAGTLPPTTKVTAELKRSYDMGNKLAESFQRIGEIAAGISIGEIVANGLERAVDLGKELVSQSVEFAKKASEAASSFELLSAGMGNLLRSQPMADAMLDRLQAMANYSPFPYSSLMLAQHFSVRNSGFVWF